MAIDPQFNVELTADELTSQIPVSILYGVSPNDKFVPVRVDINGRLQIGSDLSVSVDDVDILIKGVDPEDSDSEHRIAVENLGSGQGFAIRSALFDGANQLNINSDGSIDVNTTIMPSTTPTLTTVARSTTSQTLLAVNINRKGAIIYNDSGANLFVKFGTTASSSDFTVRLSNQDYYEVPFGYTGKIDGVWASSGGGDARMTELT